MQNAIFKCAVIVYLTPTRAISGEVKMDNPDVKDILDIDRGPATPQLSKEAIMGSLKVI